MTVFTLLADKVLPEVTKGVETMGLSQETILFATIAIVMVFVVLGVLFFFFSRGLRRVSRVASLISQKEYEEAKAEANRLLAAETDPTRRDMLKLMLATAHLSSKEGDAAKKLFLEVDYRLLPKELKALYEVLLQKLGLRTEAFLGYPGGRQSASDPLSPMEPKK